MTGARGLVHGRRGSRHPGSTERIKGGPSGSPFSFRPRPPGSPASGSRRGSASNGPCCATEPGRLRLPWRRNRQPRGRQNHANELSLSGAPGLGQGLLDQLTHRLGLPIRGPRDVGHCLAFGQGGRDAALGGRQSQRSRNLFRIQRSRLPRVNDHHQRRNPRVAVGARRYRIDPSGQRTLIRPRTEDRYRHARRIVCSAERGGEKVLEGFGVLEAVRSQPPVPFTESPVRQKHVAPAGVGLDDRTTTVEADQTDQVMIDQCTHNTLQLAGAWVRLIVRGAAPCSRH